MRHRHSGELRIWKDELAQLDSDFSSSKRREQMRSDSVGQRLDQTIRPRANKLLRLSANSRIINRALDLIPELIQIAARPERDIHRQPLRSLPFLFGNADASKQFELLDMNLMFCRFRHLPARICKRKCQRGDSNPYGFLHQILSLARLPIPPPWRPNALSLPPRAATSKQRVTKAPVASSVLHPVFVLAGWKPA